jgi:hypothetical protein
MWYKSKEQVFYGDEIDIPRRRMPGRTGFWRKELLD